MDVFDRYASTLEDGKRREFTKYKSAALEYATQGLNEDMVAELLQVDGCSIDTSHKLATAASENLPDDYLHGDPPKTFEDVSKKVEITLRTASIEDIQKYFEKYASKFSSIIEDIKTARATMLDSHYKVVIAQIRPLIDALITNNRADFKMGNITTAGKKEELEQKLWGVWSPELINKFAQREQSEGRVMSKAAKREKNYPFSP